MNTQIHEFVTDPNIDPESLHCDECGKSKDDHLTKDAQVIQQRIEACNVLIDWLIDDIPWRKQQPTLDTIRALRSNFEDQQ